MCTRQPGMPPPPSTSGRAVSCWAIRTNLGDVSLTFSSRGGFDWQRLMARACVFLSLSRAKPLANVSLKIDFKIDKRNCSVLFFFQLSLLKPNKDPSRSAGLSLHSLVIVLDGMRMQLAAGTRCSGNTCAAQDGFALVCHIFYLHYQTFTIVVSPIFTFFHQQQLV